MVSEVYKATLAASGKLKLRAKARLADGEPHDVFEACVLLHETARAEQRAVDALMFCPPETRLMALIEQCWSLVEGRDPPEAGKLWGRILHASAEVDPDTANVMLTRLAPKYAEQRQAFAEAVTRSATLMRLREARSMVTTSEVERKRARKELDALLAAFPGATSFWWMTYRLAEADDDKMAAWQALSNARRLSPENPRFEAMSLFVAAWALSVAEADEHLARVRGRFDTAGAEMCLMYALAEMRLARCSKQPLARWVRAHEAALAGLSQARTEGLHRNLRAAELLTATLRAGAQPTMEILYRAGLAEVAVTAAPETDVVELFTESVRSDMAA